MTYSIAIRTLGKNPDVLKTELNSIARQTQQPEKVMVYIADGYKRPSFTIGKEEYVWVKKGMVAQRALEYREIDSDVILMLDDDVKLADDSAEKMLNAMEEYGADCVAADTFRNQDMSIMQKAVAFIGNGVYPRCDDGWAFKLTRDAAFSYNNSPRKAFCWTETFGGPCWMIKKNVLKTVRLEDELWMDRFGFAYGEDAVESYKLFKHGCKCGILYDSGVKNMDAKTSSGDYHADAKKYYTRAYGQFVMWWRMVYEVRNMKWLSVVLFSLKIVWQLMLHLALALRCLDIKILMNYMRGLGDAVNYVKSKEYEHVPPYVID